MKSKTSKVLHEVCGAPIIDWVVDATRSVCSDSRTIIVVGHSAEQVKAHLNSTALGATQFAMQQERLGTGHAVMQAKDMLGCGETTLVVAGDTPLITSQTLIDGYNLHINSGAAVTVLTAKLKKPFGYGRIVRDGENVQKIVEEKDATEEERKICEVNSGIYFFNTQFLLDAQAKITNNNVQGEFYLTDVVEIAVSAGEKVVASIISDEKEIFGINSREQLHKANKIMQKRIVNRFMEQGVTFIDPKSVYVGKDVEIGMDSIIYPQTILEGKVKIGEDCIIMQSRIADSIIGNGTRVENSVVLSSKVGANTKVGPFAYIRPNCDIGDDIKIGDFVEVKNSSIGNGTKVSHLTYIGDADVGSGVNFGCGSVIVNYNGKQKFRSTVKDGAFIGCNVNLISPVTVKENASIVRMQNFIADSAILCAFIIVHCNFCTIY